jgi:6-phosphogluconolactonase
VYGSNRGHDSIAVFGIDQATGRLIPHGQASSGGKTPRNFTLTPDGAWLLAANQGSDNIVTFHVDAKTGALTEAGHVVHTNKPVCIVVV